jgi:hypothetical protein
MRSRYSRHFAMIARGMWLATGRKQMLGKLVKLLVLAGVVEGARRFAKANPEAAGKIAAGALGLVDQVTKGKLRAQLDAVTSKLRGGSEG